MRKGLIYAAFAAAALLATPVFAAEKPQGPREGVRAERPERPDRPDPAARLAELREKIASLDLSAEQREKVKSVLENAAAELRKLMAGFRENNADPKQRAEALKGWHESLRKALAEVLSPEQIQALVREIPRDRIQERLQTIRERLSRLNLTDEQRAKVREAFEAVRPQFEQIRKAFQAGELKPAEVREKVEALMQELRKTLSGIVGDDRPLRSGDRHTPRGADGI